MGDMLVPAEALYGAQTERARQNFPISDLRFPRRFIQAMGLIKAAAAQINLELGLLEPEKGAAIMQAAREVADGRLDEHFPLDIFQTGSGTSTNMNANEVIANRAHLLLGGTLGERSTVHPNDDVNAGQSSNDVIPTAIHLAALIALREDLIPALQRLEGALRAKAREFWPVIKTGRTHLQDATPIRLGQVFRGVRRPDRARHRRGASGGNGALRAGAGWHGSRYRGQYAGRVSRTGDRAAGAGNRPGAS